MENINMENTATTEEVGAEETTATNETLTLTKEELASMLQKETDKRVSSALKTAKSKWEAEIGTKMDSHLKDYEKRAQMTPEQIQQADLASKFQMLEAKEKEYQTMIRKNEISTKLNERKLSTVLTDFVYDEDMEVVEQRITTLEQLVLGMVNEEVEKRIGSAAPKASINSATLDREKFRKLSLAERNQLFLSNPTLYKQLSEG